ncbi:hypothetical protein [Methanobrevibacter sp.]
MHRTYCERCGTDFP